LKTVVGHQTDSSDEEEPSMLPTKAIQVEKSGGDKSCLITVDFSDEFDESDDESLSKKNQASPNSAVKPSDESSDGSKSKPEQSSVLKRSASMVAANLSSTGKDSSSSIRPLWALPQKLYKNEPPISRPSKKKYFFLFKQTLKIICFSFLI